jgi:hypothetical protein
MLYIIGGLSYCCIVYMWLLLEALSKPLQFASIVIGGTRGKHISLVLLWPILFPCYGLANMYKAIRGK